MALTDTAIKHGKPASNKPCTLTDEEGLLLQVPQRVRSAVISVSILYHIVVPSGRKLLPPPKNMFEAFGDRWYEFQGKKADEK
jgi:hypothetical protein